jgi:uncharacterized membrane protein
VEASGENSRTDAAGDPPLDHRTPFQRAEGHIFGRMASGLLVLVPLLITLVVVNFLFVGFARMFRPLIDLMKESPYVRELPVSVVWLTFTLALLLSLYIVGALVASRAGRRRVVAWQGAVLSRIPIVKTIYSVAHQATEALSSPLGHEFSRVVFLEWPRPGMRALGFVTGHSHALGDDGRSLVVVYIPTVPNPTSGNLAFVAEDEVIETELSIEDAMKVVFSGGIVLPDGLRAKYISSLPRTPDAPQPLDSSD